MAFKSLLMLSMLVLAVSADDDQTKINAAQTILTLTNSLVQIKNLLTGNLMYSINSKSDLYIYFFNVERKYDDFELVIRDEHQADAHSREGQPCRHLLCLPLQSQGYSPQLRCHLRPC